MFAERLGLILVYAVKEMGLRELIEGDWIEDWFSNPAIDRDPVVGLDWEVEENVVWDDDGNCGRELVEQAEIEIAK
jgi:hypothetical protein